MFAIQLCTKDISELNKKESRLFPVLINTNKQNAGASFSIAIHQSKLDSFKGQHKKESASVIPALENWQVV